MPRDCGHNEAEILEIEERLVELAESVSAILVWLLRYCRGKNIPVKSEELPKRMLSRIMSTLSELKSMEKLSGLAPLLSDAILQGKRSDDNYTEPDPRFCYLLIG